VARIFLLTVWHYSWSNKNSALRCYYSGLQSRSWVCILCVHYLFSSTLNYQHNCIISIEQLQKIQWKIYHQIASAFIYYKIQFGYGSTWTCWGSLQHFPRPSSWHSLLPSMPLASTLSALLIVSWPPTFQMLVPLLSELRCCSSETYLPSDKSLVAKLCSCVCWQLSERWNQVVDCKWFQWVLRSCEGY